MTRKNTRMTKQESKTFRNFPIVHENENYLVLIAVNQTVEFGGSTYTGAYIVHNKLTDITEFKSQNLPETLFVSEQLNQALLTRGWEWHKEKEQPTELNPELFVN